MPILELNNQLLFVKLELEPTEIASLLDKHSDRWPGAKRLEKLALELRQTQFEPVASMKFFVEVLEWGGGHRNIKRAKKNNEPDDLSKAFAEADAKASTQCPAEAVERVQTLHQIGQSFASKIVRFLQPDHAVILDKRIREGLGYPETKEGYVQFLADCQHVLSKCLPVNPALRICDIEAAIFAKLQRY